MNALCRALYQFEIYQFYHTQNKWLMKSNKWKCKRLKSKNDFHILLNDFHSSTATFMGHSWIEMWNLLSHLMEILLQKLRDQPTYLLHVCQNRDVNLFKNNWNIYLYMYLVKT